MSPPNRPGAADRLAEVRRRIPDHVLRLAYHAALPVVIDPGLLNLLRVNFFLDPPDALPFEAEADLLLSPLFREIGDCLYEMLPEIRNILLVGLQTSYGNERVRQVALLLEQYSTPVWNTQPQLERAQQLTALNFVDPVRAAQWLESAHADAAGAMIGPEWYVAMRHRLGAQPKPDRAPREVARAANKLRNTSQEVRLGAVRALAALAQLPGTDITPAGEALLDMMRYQPDVDAPDVRAAMALLRMLGGRYATEAAVRADRDPHQRAMDSDPPETAPMALTNLGVRNAEMGRFEEARKYYEQALELFRQAGDRHHEGQVLTHIGDVYVRIGRSEDAREQWQRALNMMRGVGDQMAAARLMQKIAAAYQSSGDLSGALTALEEAAAIYRGLAESSPAALPDLAVSLNDLAQVLSSLGRPSEAVNLYQNLLSDQERVLSADHPETLVTRRNIAFWTGESGRPAEALRLYQELLPDQERVMGADHPDTLAIRGNIAFWTGECEHQADALRLYQELLPDQERVMGADHPETLVTRRNIAFWTGESGRPAEALRLYQELLPDQERVMGADHPDTLAIRGNIAFWTGECERPAEALRLYQELLPDQERVMDTDHHNTLAIRGNIAFWTNKIGQPAEALRLYQELLPDEERVLGSDHHNTKATRSNIEALTDSRGPASEFFP